MERLRAQADPVHPGLGQQIRLVLVERSRIGLDGPFPVRRKDQPFPDHRRQSFQAANVQSSRRSPADEDRVDRLRRAELQCELAFQGVEIAIGEMIDAG